MDQSNNRKIQQEEQLKMVHSLIRVLKLQLGHSLNKEQMDIISRVLEKGDLAKCADDVYNSIMKVERYLKRTRVGIHGRIVEDY